jgi:hypothetical protein
MIRLPEGSASLRGHGKRSTTLDSHSATTKKANMYRLNESNQLHPQPNRTSGRNTGAANISLMVGSGPSCLRRFRVMALVSFRMDFMWSSCIVLHGV